MFTIRCLKPPVVGGGVVLGDIGDTAEIADLTHYWDGQIARGNVEVVAVEQQGDDSSTGGASDNTDNPNVPVVGRQYTINGRGGHPILVTVTQVDDNSVEYRRETDSKTIDCALSKWRGVEVAAEQQ